MSRGGCGIAFRTADIAYQNIFGHYKKPQRRLIESWQISLALLKFQFLFYCLRPTVSNVTIKFKVIFRL